VTYELPSAIRTPNGETICTARGSSSRQRLQYTAPPFLAAAKLPQLGFRAAGIGKTSLALPDTPSLASSAPERTLDSAGPLQRWEWRIGSDGRKATASLEVDGDNRLRVEHSITINGREQVMEERWVAYGPIHVYAAGSVPASVFAMSRYGCGE
jgi:hypothetical protein